MPIQVTAVRVRAGGSTHEHIEQVQYRDQASARADVSYVSQVVDFIDRGGSAFTSDGRVQAQVGVVRPGGSAQPYIRTYADGRWTNNLLSLPRF